MKRGRGLSAGCRTPPKGVEAQTLANVYQAIEADHEIVPVLNKIDLPASDCDRVAEQIEDVIGIDATGAIAGLCQNRTSASVKPSQAIVDEPAGPGRHPRCAAESDAGRLAWYDAYLGVDRSGPHHGRHPEKGSSALSLMSNNTLLFCRSRRRLPSGNADGRPNSARVRSAS